MSYYRGDWYPGGGYYRGDPGFFSGLARTLGGAALGFVTGGPAGAVAGGIGGLLGGGGGGAPAAAGMAGPGRLAVIGANVARRVVQPVTTFVRGHPVLSAAGAAAGVGGVASRVIDTHLMRPGGGAPGQKGFHISRRTGRVVRNRRMRVTNPKALRRAIRRAEGFSHLALRVLRFTHPKRVHGKPHFKMRKRRA